MQTMKTLFLTIALVLGASLQSKAVWFDISFDLGPSSTGVGQFQVFTNSNNDFYAVSGFLDIFGGAITGLDGHWTLYAEDGYVNYPSRLTSPAGAYWYNNSVYVEGNNAQFPITNPLLDQYGLLFRLDSNPASELNLWGNADGSYTLGGTINGGWQNFNVVLSVDGNNGPGIVIAQAPEPTTATLIILGGLALVATANRRKSVL